MANRFIVIISLIFICSCSTRKVDVSKIDNDIKIDSSLVVHTDGTYVKDNNIFIDEKIDEVEYTPIDSLKPMKINDIVYNNTKIKAKKYSKKTIDTTKTVIKIKEDKKVVLKKEVKKSIVNKKVNKKTNYLYLLWLLIPIGLLVLIKKYGVRFIPILNIFKK